MHWNAEGVYNKKAELEQTLHSRDISICCIQETHLQKDKTFRVRGYQIFRADRQDRNKGGVLTLVRNNINACEVKSYLQGPEYHELKIKAKSTELNLVNFYCPNDRPLSLDTVEVTDSRFLMVGDFNSHSQSWGYAEADRRGNEVEDWQDDHSLILINDPYDPPTFYSRRWRTTTTPDLAFCTEDIHRGIRREVGDQLGGSDHKPVYLTISTEGVGADHPHPRWNYKKAKWDVFAHRTNTLTRNIQVQGRDVNNVVREFNGFILQAAKETIPRGARKEYRPYWSNQLQSLQDELNEARTKAEEQPSQENHERLQQAKAKFLRTKLEATRRSWREKTAALNMEKDGRKLWKITKQLNDEDSRGQKITLEEDGKLLTGKQTADHFARAYEKESNIHVSPSKRREARREQRERANQRTAPDPMKLPITLQELQTALRKLKKKKSPGPDGITNEMLTHLGNTATHKLLEIFNLSWEEGKVPQIWREAIMIPVYKKGKDRKIASSYRPISLTSCVVKTMERIVNTRLMWYLETEDILSEEQAGFRQFRCTEDQTTYLAQEIEDAFQEQKVLFATWIDLQKAFDKVWTEGLLVKLQRCGIADKMLRWITSFLDNRRARVTVDNQRSKKFLIRHGVPQGGVVSPTLFLIFIDDLLAELPRGIKAALYADDLVLWCVEEHATTATYRMQMAADKLAAWADDWCISINKEKSSTTLFTLSTKQQAGAIKLGETKLKNDNEPTYLGVTFDKRQTWKPHVQKAEAKGKRKMAILRKLAGTTWGANERIMKTVYEGAIRPQLEYGSTAWSTSAKTNQQALDRVQNQALRLITGAMKTTPIQAMEKVTGIQPLQERRDTKILLQAEKFRCQNKHPMNQKVEGLTKNRLKRSSFVHDSKRLRRAHISHLPAKTLPPTLHQSRPWCDTSENKRLTICPTLPQVNPGATQGPAVKCALTRALIDESYPGEAWVQVYTDGSATQAVTDGGAGVYLRYPDGQTETVAMPTGKHCSNYSAEVQALMAAASVVQRASSEFQQVVFLTDALSVLEALSNNKEPHLMEALQSISESRRVVLQWVPAHCGVPGNEAADRLAKKGARESQPDRDLTYREKCTLIKTARKPAIEKDDYHRLTRQEQVLLIRLRTGHNRLNSHMFRKLGLAPSPNCSCGTGEQTAEHILQQCPNLREQRKTVWPADTPLHTKLYGCLQDLRGTAHFIHITGLLV